MNAKSEARIDAMPMLIVVLVLITLFVLIRPPILLLFDDGSAMAELDRQISKEPHPTIPSPARVNTPIQAPPLPSSLVAATRVAPPPRWTDSISVDPDTARMSDDIHTLTNEKRTMVDLKPLEQEPILAGIATRHSKDMVQNDYLAHTSEDGDGPAQRVGMLHRRLFGRVGENVALNESQPVDPRASAEQFMQQWMNSLGHRRNILSESYDQLGVGCFQQQDPATKQVDRRCTQLFAQAFAQSTEDIPEQVQAGEPLPISIVSRPGVLPPAAIAQIDLRNGRELSRAQLTERGGIAMGELQITGGPGIYGLQLHIPKNQRGTSFSLIPGPYFVVK